MIWSSEKDILNRRRPGSATSSILANGQDDVHLLIYLDTGLDITRYNYIRTSTEYEGHALLAQLSIL